MYRISNRSQGTAGHRAEVKILRAGPWNPEPKAYERFSRWFQKQTSIKLDVQPVNMLNLSANQTPVAVLTGNAAVDFSKMDLHALHEYVANGGVLLIDSTGGNKAFAESVRQSLLPAAFSETQPTGIPGEHPILAGGGRSRLHGSPSQTLRCEIFASMQLNGVPPSVEYATVGKGNDSHQRPGPDHRTVEFRYLRRIFGIYPRVQPVAGEKRNTVGR